MASTGYQGWVNGADYKVEAGKLYKHEWADSWVEVLTFSSGQLVKDTSVLEISIPKTSLYGIDEFVGVGYRDIQGTTVLGSLPAFGNFVTYNFITPVSVPRPAVSITVDGASSDWAYLPPVATSSGVIELMKVYDNETNIYVLLKGALTSTAADYEVYFNTDNSSTTGFVDEFNWVAMGADYAIIGGLLYKHDPTAGNAWGWIYQSHTITTSFDGTTTTQEIVIPRSKFNALSVGTILTVGYRKLSSGAFVAKLPASGGMANYRIENPYIPNLQTLTVTDDIANIYLTVRGSSITTNYKAFLNTDNTTSTGYADAFYWSTMGTEYMIENGSFYLYNGTGQAWGWTSASNTVQVSNTVINANLDERVITIPKAEFPALGQGDIIAVGFANDGASDKLPAGNALQSFTLTKDYIPALSSFALSDNSINIFATVQGSVMTPDYELFLNTDNNTSTGYIDGIWSTMGADYLVQNGSLYLYSGTSNAWGWTLVQTGLQVDNAQLDAELKQRQIIIPRAKLPSFTIGNTIKGGYRNVVGGSTAAAIPGGAGAMLSYAIATSFVGDLQSIGVSDNSTEIILTVTGGNLSSDYQIYLNTDNVASSGYTDATWTSTGIDYMIENGTLYQYSGTSNSWSWSSISGNVSVSNNTVSGVTTRTVTITKAALTNLGGTVKSGYRNLVSWSLSGKLPAGDEMFSYRLLPTSQNIGETGSLTFSQANKNTWTTRTLTRSYNNPVVIVSPLSYNGSEPATIRVKNVTGNSFQYQIDEWDYLDGVHGSEIVYYLVVEAGRYTLDGDVVMEAGTVSVNNNWSLIEFQEGFESENVPLVFAQTMTYNVSTAVTTRIRWISASDFELKIQEEESTDYIRNRIRGSETVGYVAFTEGSGDFGNPFEVNGTSRSYDNDFKKVWFNDSYTTPAILAHMQTSYGGNTAALRYRSLNSTSVSFKVEEEQSYGFETEHTAEEIGYLVLGGTGVVQGISEEGSAGGRMASGNSKKEIEETSQSGLLVYPNPVRDNYLTVYSEEGINQLSVVNLNGTTVYSDNVPEKEKRILTHAWAPGLYIVKTVNDKGKIAHVKVVK